MYNCLLLAVDRFPSLERDKAESLSPEDQKRSRSAKAQDFNHTREDIFALPSMQLHLKTEHLQAALTPDGTGKELSFSFVAYTKLIKNFLI